MENDLISKKELLELTGISYGQLYRWKRKKLIPEDWFIKKSSFTGQETFFPKDKILSRIDKIKGMKEDVSLDELADVFSPASTNIVLTKDELIERNIVTDFVYNLYIKSFREQEEYEFEKVLQIYIMDKLLKSGDVSQEEAKQVLSLLISQYDSSSEKNIEIIIIRKFGVSAFMLVSAHSEIFFDEGVKIVFRQDIAGFIEELKIKLS